MKKTSFLLLIVFLVVNLFVLTDTENVYARDLSCPTPASIMLHSDFGSFLMEKLAIQIISDGYVTMTYDQVYDLWDRGECPPSNAILVSIDDLSGAWLKETFKDMIQVFIDHGLVLTVGVVSYTPDISVQNPVIWEYFKEIDKAGIEIASHSTHHYSLTQLGRKGIDIELHESYEIICENLGKCPRTFILPFGNGWDVKDVMESASGLYRSLVSIAGPHDFGGNLFIMRRIPPPDNITALKEFLNKYFPLVAEPVVQDVSYKHILVDYCILMQ